MRRQRNGERSILAIKHASNFIYTSRTYGNQHTKCSWFRMSGILWKVYVCHTISISCSKNDAIYFRLRKAIQIFLGASCLNDWEKRQQYLFNFEYLKFDFLFKPSCISFLPCTCWGLYQTKYNNGTNFVFWYFSEQCRTLWGKINLCENGLSWIMFITYFSLSLEANMNAETWVKVVFGNMSTTSFLTQFLSETVNKTFPKAPAVPKLRGEKSALKAQTKGERPLNEALS